MKKTEGYRIRKLEDEYVVLPFGKRAEEVNEVISLSETAGFMYLHAEEADSAEELAELVSKAYAVSYTHLDVYKRQGHSGRRRNDVQSDSGGSQQKHRRTAEKSTEMQRAWAESLC